MPSPLTQGPRADVGTVVHPVEADPANTLIRPLAGGCEGVPEAGDPQHPAAGGHDAAGCAGGPGVEDEEIGLPFRLCEAVDREALRRRAGIAGRGQHHADRRAIVPVDRETVQPVRPARLWSCTGKRGTTVLPSVKAMTVSSSPSRNSSTTTCDPASPNALRSSMARTASLASARVPATITPFPCASPSALTTIGMSRCSR